MLLSQVTCEKSKRETVADARGLWRWLILLELILADVTSIPSNGITGGSWARKHMALSVYEQEWEEDIPLLWNERSKNLSAATCEMECRKFRKQRVVYVWLIGGKWKRMERIELLSWFWWRNRLRLRFPFFPSSLFRHWFSVSLLSSSSSDSNRLYEECVLCEKPITQLLHSLLVKEERRKPPLDSPSHFLLLLLSHSISCQSSFSRSCHPIIR